MADAKFCDKCRKLINIKDFYKSNNLEKHPDGYMDICKKCATMHVDNWDPDTYLPTLEDCDVPYIPGVWNEMLLKYGRDKSKVSGMTIIGRYLATMKIKQYNQWRWKDSEYLQAKADKEVEETMKRQGYSMQEIDEVIQNSKKPGGEKPWFEEEPDFGSKSYEDYFGSDMSEDLDLTEEEKVMLRLKWGKAYRPEEWVQLEQLFVDMMNSYDITAAGDINSLKMMCKASLKANQLMDIGDIDGAQKMTKVYDGLMKAGKWTAAQNKTDGNEIVDSVGELVALCEKDHYFERFYIDTPKDKADKIIIDNQKYLFELVNNESSLNNLIENALKSIEDEKNMIEKAGEEAEKMNDDESLFDYDSKIDSITDEDFQDFENFKEEELSFNDFLGEEDW